MYDSSSSSSSNKKTAGDYRAINTGRFLTATAAANLVKRFVGTTHSLPSFQALAHVFCVKTYLLHF